MARDPVATLSVTDLGKIGADLRQYYDYLTKMPLPARMQFLLRQIEASERKS